MRINIVIDSIVLQGYDNYDSDSIITALQSNLSQLVEQNGSTFSQSAIGESSSSKQSAVAFNEPIEIYSNADHNSIGAHLAQSIYDRLAKPVR